MPNWMTDGSSDGEGAGALSSGLEIGASGYAAGGFAALGLLQGAKQAADIQQAAQLTYNLAQVNAKYALVDANNATLMGYTQEARYASVINQTVSKQRAAYAGAGADVGYGTAAAVQDQTKETGLLNQLDMLSQAHAKALGFQNESRNILQGASVAQDQAEMNANGVASSAAIGAAGTLSKSKDVRNLLGYNLDEES